MSVLVGKPAPDFTATAVLPDNSFDEQFSLTNFRGKHVVLFFYPLDFTIVCPTELIAFDHRVAEFEKRNAQLIGVSIDSHVVHLAWRNTPPEKGGIGQVRFPLVADISKQITEAYDMRTGPGIALRGTFIIDREGIVQHQLVNMTKLGRNVDETLRTLDALQFFEAHGEVCPAGWQPGKAAVKPTAAGLASYLTEHAAEL
jgi:peroxiredoxin (alkyl hydroperoxide reductase subunit C)